MRMLFLIASAFIVLTVGVLDVVAAQLTLDRLGEVESRPAPTWFSR